jgi:hypothetical protein
VQWLTAQPERTGRSIFDELQQRYSGQFASTQLRTLQRHIALWRANTVLAFDDNVTEDIERIALASLPRMSPRRNTRHEPARAAR